MKENIMTTTTTTTTATTITPEEAFELWYEAINGAYCDETDDDVKCSDCGGTFYQHDPDDDDRECDDFVADTVHYLSDHDGVKAALEAKLVAAYEATKHIAYADMPAYDDSDMYNPWNVMNDLRMVDYFEALDAPQEWVEGWMTYTNAN